MPGIPRSVRPGLGFLPPARRPWLLAIARPFSWLYLRLIGVRRVETVGVESLVRLCREMQEGRIRLILAFRHPSTDDPPVVFHLLTGIVARASRRLGVRLRRPARGLFLYGRDVPEWSGRWLAWLFPRIGAISVFPGKFDTASLSVIRRTLTDAPHPLAIAPEGQVNYHDEIVSALEPGTAQLGLWCMEDLRRQGRSEEVTILPIGLSYHYREADWRGVDRLLARIEQESGVPILESPAGESPYARVIRAARHLVSTAEAHYSRFYGASFPPAAAEEDPASLQRRIAAVVEAALAVAEHAFGVSPRGDWVQRVQVLRYAGLGRMHRSDIAEVSHLAPLDRALADRIAAEAWLVLRHVELVDFLEYLRLDRLSPSAGIDRYAEAAGNLWDMVNRLNGGNISGRLPVGRRAVRVVVGEPILVSRFWEGSRSNRRQGVRDLTAEIFRGFQRLSGHAGENV